MVRAADRVPSASVRSDGLLEYRRALAATGMDGATSWVRRAGPCPLVSHRLWRAGHGRCVPPAESAAGFWARLLDGLRQGMGQHPASRRLDGGRHRTAGAIHPRRRRGRVGTVTWSGRLLGCEDWRLRRIERLTAGEANVNGACDAVLGDRDRKWRGRGARAVRTSWAVRHLEHPITRTTAVVFGEIPYA